MTAFRAAGIVWTLAAAATALAQRSSLTAPQYSPPLRYELQVGDRLVYERRARVSELSSGEQRRRFVDQIQVWCLSVENNEAYVLLDLTRVEGRRVAPVQGALLLLNRRGELRIEPELLTRIAELDPAFDVIPEMRPAAKPGPGWLSSPDLYGRRRRCTQVGPDEQRNGQIRVDYSVEDPTGVAAIMGLTHTGRFWFDAAAGLVTRVESQRHDRSAGLRTDSITFLRERRRQASRWCAERLSEARRFLRMLRHEARVLDEVVTRPDEIEHTLRQLDRLWSGYVADTARDKKSPLRLLGAARRRILAARAATLRERARQAGSWLGGTAAHWSLQDPSGNTVTSESLRDRIVVECFWSTKSLGSLRAMETMRRTNRELPQDAVGMVCINIDQEIEPARRAARCCGEGVLQVLAGAPVGGQAPRELPIFRVLSRESTVLRVYFGWRPSLTEQLKPLVR